MTRDEYKKHKNIIDAWGDGAVLQFRNDCTGTWQDFDSNSPSWSKLNEYRVKPFDLIVGDHYVLKLNHRSFIPEKSSVAYIHNFKNEIFTYVGRITDEGDTFDVFYCHGNCVSFQTMSDEYIKTKIS